MYWNKLSMVSLLLALMLCSSIAGAFLINPSFADTERVVNGGFETGNLNGWTVQEPPLWEGGVSKAYAHSGTYSLFLAQVDSIYQAFNPPVSTTGDLSLWAMSTGDETYPLAVTITYSDGTSNSTGVTPLGGYHVWVYYTLPVDHTKLVSQISFFTWEMMFPGYYVDDVSLMGPSAGYSATIWGWDYVYGWQVPVPITMDGATTGYSTPHTFSGLTGTHTFTVPSTNSAGHPFSDWSTNWTDRTITVGLAGTYTARYRAGYSATIWSWCALDAWLTLPITMDGVATGYSTPQIFSGLTGTHAFKVPSTDANGHPFYQWSTGSTSTTLTTTVAGVYTARYEPKEIIVDNPAAVFSGAWTHSTSVAGYYGSDYQYHAAGTGTNTATWSFSIPTAGSWQVYARWTSWNNRATNAPYTVYYAGGSTTVTKNQQVNGGSWISLGTYSFNAGSYSVRLTDNANGIVIADAIRLMPAAAPSEIIVDNPAAAFVGTWPSSTSVAGYYGSNYQYHAPGTGTNTATWSFTVPTAGSWQVYARWTSYSNRATNAPYTVYYAGGSATVTVNQQANGGSWQSLGTFSFNAGSYSVVLTDNANAIVIADGIRLVPA